MPSFAYQARNKGGQAVSGTQDAPDQRAAIESLRAAGLYVTKIGATRSRGEAVQQNRTEQRPFVPNAAEAVAAPSSFPPPATPRPNEPPPVAAPPLLTPPDVTVSKPQTSTSTKLTGRASAKEMALFFRQMGSMINAGTVLSHALNTLAQNSPNGALREACRNMSLRVAQGTPWSETMKPYPGLFSELMIGLVAAGEAGGFLDRICMRLAEYSERDYNLQQTIKRETWYPKLLVFCSILIPSVVPLVLTGMGVMQGNPLVNWFRSVVGPLSLVFIVWATWKIVHYASPVTARGGSVRHVVDSLKLMVPVAGKAVRGLAVAKFCRALSAMYMAGMAPHRGFEVAARACGNAAVGQAALRAIPRLETGQSMSEVLQSTGQFQPVVLQMLQSGEETGSVDTQLDKVADFLEQDAETTIQQAVKVLGIVAFLAMAAYIGSQVIQGYAGYLNELTSVME